MGKVKKKLNRVAVYRAGYSCPVDPTTAHETLESIRRGNDGTLRAADVVEESRPQDAPLHPAFTWDDREAAELWREDEARRLIRSVHIMTETETDAGTVTEVTPIYVHVPSESGRDQQGYQPVTKVVADPSSHQRVIDDALAQLRGWQKRFGWIKELGAVVSAIETVAEELSAGGHQQKIPA